MIREHRGSSVAWPLRCCSWVCLRFRISRRLLMVETVCSTKSLVAGSATLLRHLVAGAVTGTASAPLRVGQLVAIISWAAATRANAHETQAPPLGAVAFEAFAVNTCLEADSRGSNCRPRRLDPLYRFRTLLGRLESCPKN